MSNVSGKAYAMTVLTPMPPGRTWINVLLFRLARLMPSTLAGLKGLSLIHFARWAVIRRRDWPQQDGASLQHDYMLFCSNFNGTWDQYIDAFADGIPTGLDLFWYASQKYTHSIPITPFKDYIRANQIDNAYYYNATPGAAQRDVKAALRVRAAVLELARETNGATAEAFAAAWRRSLRQVQNDLGRQGYAPVASADTERADRNRLALAGPWPPQATVSLAAPQGTGAAPRASPKHAGPTDLDGGHGFLTVLLPLNTAPCERADGTITSAAHAVRELLSALPTAQHSPECAASGRQSPFAADARTHFARLAVIDAPAFNGRVPADAILSSLPPPKDPLVAQPVDVLPRAYLLFCADFDRPPGPAGEAMAAYTRGLCNDTPELWRAILSHCAGAPADGGSPAAAADYVLGCRIDTTMPFNDYAVGAGAPGVPPIAGAAAIALAAAAATFLALWRGAAWPWVAAGAAGVVAGVLALGVAVWGLGARGAPATAGTDLPTVLKSLHVQAAFARFALARQGDAPQALQSAFAGFLDQLRPDDLAGPTQAAGVVP